MRTQTAMTGNEAPPVQVLAQTPVGRDPELPLYNDDEATAYEASLDVATEFLALLSDVAMVS